jgi:AP-3 complex subunit sigma
MRAASCIVGACGAELSIEDWGECKVVYRHYATLYFIFIVDRQESDLGILDLIQVSFS